MELYFAVFFTKDMDIVGQHSFYVDYDEDKNEVVYNEVRKYRRIYNSWKESLFIYNKQTRKMNEVTEKFAEVLRGNEKDNQIKKWLNDSERKLKRLGCLDIDNGEFQAVFISHLEKEGIEYELKEGDRNCSITYKGQKNEGFFLSIEDEEELQIIGMKKDDK